MWREENQRTQRKTLGAGIRTNNKLNPHMHVMSDLGIEPGPQLWEPSALNTPSLHPQILSDLDYEFSGKALNSDFSLKLEKKSVHMFLTCDNPEGI